MCASDRDENGVQLDVGFLGDRDYVNGVTLLEAAFAVAEAEAGRQGRRIVRIRKAECRQFIAGACRIRAQKTTSASGSPTPQAVFEYDLDAPGGRLRYAVYAEAGDVPRRPDYDRQIYLQEISHDMASGTTVGTLVAPYDVSGFFRGLVEANHQFCINVARRLGGQARSFFWGVEKLPVPEEGMREKSCGFRLDHTKTLQSFGKTFIVRKLSFPACAGLGGGPPEDHCNFLFFLGNR